MDFETILSELISAVKCVSPQLVVLCLLAADPSAQYPLSSEEETKGIISASLQLIKSASPTLHLVSKVEPLLHAKTRKLKISVRPSRDPVACYAGIKRQLETAIGNSLEASTMDILFPRSSLTAFYTALAEDERRQALDELVLVAHGWVQAFQLHDVGPGFPIPDFTARLAALDGRVARPDFLAQTAAHYVAEVRRITGRAKFLDSEIARLGEEAKEKRRGKRAEVFALLAELGAMRRDRLELGNLGLVDGVLTALEEALEAPAVAAAPAVEGQGPERIVLEEEWGRLGLGEKAREIFLTYEPQMTECGVEVVSRAGGGGEEDEWTKLRRMMELVNLKKKKTRSTQTESSAFREGRATQVYEAKEAGTSTMVEQGVQPVRTRRYVAGLRGEFVDVHWRIL